MLRLLLFLLSNLFLAACAPATLQGLREHPSGQFNFEVAKSYQPVYQTILSNARRCYHPGRQLLGLQIVQGDLYTDTRTAEIAVAIDNDLDGVDTYLGIDIKALSDESTEVRTFFGSPFWKARARAVEAWVQNGSRECSVSSLKLKFWIFN